jgi:hypothetical protein
MESNVLALPHTDWLYHHLRVTGELRQAGARRSLPSLRRIDQQVELRRFWIALPAAVIASDC